jgi:hypothetical protein
VLCGNFASRANAAAISTGSKLRQFFKNLASVLAKTPVLARHAEFGFKARLEKPFSLRALEAALQQALQAE